MKHIIVASDFSKYPAGRVVSDGHFSGEAFREKLLVPALRDNDKVCVNLDGTRGYGSSFLEEAFGGLVRVNKFTVKELSKKLSFVSSRKTYIVEILSYINSAGSQG